MFNVEIATTTLGDNPSAELSKILHDLAVRVGEMDMTKTGDHQKAIIFRALRDNHNNPVGSASYTEEGFFEFSILTKGNNE